MTTLLALVTVVSFGVWIPISQALPGVPQRLRTFYAGVGNLVLASCALVVGGGHLSVGWRQFWLPLAGGVVWTAGSFAAFRAAATIGLARAAGTWTPLNIITSFVWGALLFGELNRLSASRFVVLGVGLVIVLIGVLLIVGSKERPGGDVSSDSGRVGALGGIGTFGRGVMWATAAGVLWGSYFVPAQWARVPSQVGNFPLAVGILVAGVALVLPGGESIRLSPRVTGVQLTAGILFGIGNLALLSLVARVGTGVGFTIAQLSLLVNAGIGMWVFKVPRPGSSASRRVLLGILVAGTGGILIGVLK
jgi:glucose uptake protein GlcU